MRRERYPWARPVLFHPSRAPAEGSSSRREITAVRSTKSGGWIAYRSEVQMASRLAHNQKKVSSILTAANFPSTAPWSNSTTPLS